MRTLALGKVVSRIAALWRAHAGKRAYHRMKEAWFRMQTIVKAHLLRRKFLRMRAAAVKVQKITRGFLVRKSEAVESLRQTLGLVLCFGGKMRRRLSARWEIPQHDDFLGMLVPGTSAVALPYGSVLKKLQSLRPPQSPDSLAYADYVLKIRQTYKIVRRAVVVTGDYLMSFNADAPGPGQLGSLNRAIPIAEIEKVSMSRFRDSYVAISAKDSYAFVCICETKVSLVRALAARYRALTQGGSLPVEVGERLTYKAYKSDGPDKLRSIHFQQVPNAAVFETRVQEPWEPKLLSLPGGIGGGKASEAAGEDAASSTVKEAYAKAERFRPFHTIQGDRLSLVVSVPVPPKLKLVDLLSSTERDKLKTMGVRGLK